MTCSCCILQQIGGICVNLEVDIELTYMLHAHII